MALSVLTLLTTEIQHGLKVLFINQQNQTHPDKPYHDADQIAFDVVLRNTNPVPIRNIRGLIAPGASGQFIEKAFEAAELAPGTGLKLQTITATLTSRLPDWFSLESVARVTLTAQADLSAVEINDGEVFSAQVLVP